MGRPATVRSFRGMPTRLRCAPLGEPDRPSHPVLYSCIAVRLDIKVSRTGL